MASQSQMGLDSFRYKYDGGGLKPEEKRRRMWWATATVQPGWEKFSNTYGQSRSESGTGSVARGPVRGTGLRDRNDRLNSGRGKSRKESSTSSTTNLRKWQRYYERKTGKSTRYWFQRKKSYRLSYGRGKINCPRHTSGSPPKAGDNGWTGSHKREIIEH